MRLALIFIPAMLSAQMSMGVVGDTHAAAGGGSWPLGIQFNFRGTLAGPAPGVTDPANSVYVDAADAFPHTYTIGPYTVIAGWSTVGGVSLPSTSPCVGGAPSSTDRVFYTGAQAPLSGIHYTSASRCFTVQVAAGTTYTFGVAMGDAGFSNIQGAKIYDGGSAGSSLAWTIATRVTTGAAQWVDATGVTRTSPGDWVANGATKQVTIGTTYFNVAIATEGGETSTIATLTLKTP